jgi:peroxiredoxin
MISKRIWPGLASLTLVGGLAAVTFLGQTTQPMASQSVGSQPPASQPAPDATASAHITPEARALLERVRNAYAALHSLDLAGTVSIAFDGGGQQRSDHADFTGAFRAPSQFRHEMKDETTVITSADKLYTYLPRKNAYISDPAPKSRGDALPDQVQGLLMDQDPSLLLAFSADAAAAIAEGATDISIADARTIDGVVFPSLRVERPDEDETITIDPKTDLIRSVQHDLIRSMKRQGVPNLKTAMVTVDYLPTAQQPAAVTPQQIAFDWTPPAGARPLAPAPQAPDQADPSAPIAAAMNGKPAPDFTLKTPDGKSVALSDLKGSVVVLDFWATWCPPCREGLPHIAAVAKARAKDGVQVFIINQGEDAPTVKSFLQQQNLDLTALLDGDSAVGGKYQAQTIPETVVIDKNGVVRMVATLPAYGDEEKALNGFIDDALGTK